MLMTMIVQLTTGYYETLPPRRNMDWNEMKFRNYTDKDNYITKTHFVFNVSNIGLAQRYVGLGLVLAFYNINY